MSRKFRILLRRVISHFFMEIWWMNCTFWKKATLRPRAFCLLLSYNHVTFSLVWKIIWLGLYLNFLPQPLFHVWTYRKCVWSTFNDNNRPPPIKGFKCQEHNLCSFEKRDYLRAILMQQHWNTNHFHISRKIFLYFQAKVSGSFKDFILLLHLMH